MYTLNGMELYGYINYIANGPEPKNDKLWPQQGLNTSFKRIIIMLKCYKKMSLLEYYGILLTLH